MSASGTESRAVQARERRGCEGYLSLHFVRFEYSLLGKKAGKSEGH